ncbi:CPBP family intramembrane glutamic endopeptidase [Anaerotalea alkaliphila]|uniref:CPBP family intramembrane metalloprotease n=1 Tax=Anaerotalea alkaliphila TaxID=2662126 RepID=A0A7X5HW23_9FIRM|nr:type II CAAX endopeptidase family protein [Anaerotalea alkaliphila]NDL67715.1 CPBP family intramembrane metalloprotease [Anaerotalea alkaliphila]
MYSVRRGNNYQLFAILFFLLGSNSLGLIIQGFGLEIPFLGLTAISQLGLVFLPVLLYVLYTRVPLRPTFQLYRLDIVNLLLSLGIAVLVMPALSLVNILSQFLVKNYIAESLMEMQDLSLGTSILFIGVFPGIFEELSARSIILSNYRGKPVRTTCLVSGLFFGILHLNLNQFSYAVLMGILLALVVHLTGSIFSAMAIHFTINASMLVYQRLIFDVMDGMGADLGTLVPAGGVDNYSLLTAAGALLLVNLLTFPLLLLVLRLMALYNGKAGLLKANAPTGAFLPQVPGEPAMPEMEEESIWTPQFFFMIFLFLLYVVLFEILLPRFMTYG